MDICTCDPRKHGTFFVNGRLICIYCRQPIADDTIADLEAQITNQGQIIEQLAKIIREYKTSSEMGVEAIRAQAAEIERLRAVIASWKSLVID